MKRADRGISALAVFAIVLSAFSFAPFAIAGGHGGRQEHGNAPARGAASSNGAKKTLIPKLPPDVRKDYQKYCFNIADAARDARYARQKKQLGEMEKRLRKLMRKLEKKREELETWVLQRKEIKERMTRSMLDVYAKMEPEAAAAHIAQMEYEVAVAILTGLKPQKASAILTEMDPKKAGRLVNAIVGVVAEAAPRVAGETN